jgi:hypothetical protein
MDRVEMEICNPADDPKPHKWLQWLGLQQPPAEPDSWVPVVRGLHITDQETGTSALATVFIEFLEHSGVEALQRSYEFDNTHIAPRNAFPPIVQEMVTRVAVLVHMRDRARAIQVAERTNEALREVRLLSSPVSPDELARQALAVGRPTEGSSGYALLRVQDNDLVDMRGATRR